MAGVALQRAPRGTAPQAPKPLAISFLISKAGGNNKIRLLCNTADREAVGLTAGARARVDAGAVDVRGLPLVALLSEDDHQFAFVD